MQDFKEYENYLFEEEKSENTIKKYLRDLRHFLTFSNGKTLSKKTVLAYKQHLIENYSPCSVNSMLASINSYLSWKTLPQFKVKRLKIQKDIFMKPEKELSQQEYQKLLQVAEQRNPKISLIIQTICSTGIRVSELKYITVQSLAQRRTQVRLKNKTRTIFIQKELCKKLKEYCKKNKIKSDVIFRTKNNNAIDRSNIWKMMKSLCKEANVLPSKVFPHNLRHLFARTYYKINKDISKLADLLGHSCIETTRIYTIETEIVHKKQLDKMGLLI